uniref:Neuronal tyrosine phosphorylated phosphoinositide-3-kinase adaptor 1 n=1 Tax=Seriola lalandi dorsalis TaxID=1841481 RepID=A0A3B4XV99_SERLL
CITAVNSGIFPSDTTVGKVRDLASFRRHFRMGFMTMPASQDLSPHSCASAMAPRSQSCHAVGAGDTSLENGDYSDTQSQHGGRCPPAKPKRHPSTRLSSSSADSRGPPETPPPPPPTHSQKSDSGEIGAKKVPPLKPKRSPSTQLSFDPLPPRVPPATSLPFQAADSQNQTADGDDEPVYIEMVGQVFTRDSQTATPHPVTPVATTPDSDSDQSEAIYEEMKYPLQEDRESQRHLPPKHEKLKTSKHFHVTPSSSSSSSSLPRPSSSSPSYSKPKATPEANTKIPAPFPNLLQHRPPLLAFPQPAAASSGVGVVTTQANESSGGCASQQDKHSRDSQLGPAPGLRARSHSTPLPPSSKSTSPFSHHHHHPHHRPSHYHHYRKPERGDSPAPTKSSSQGSNQATVQTQTSSTGKEGKSVSFLLNTSSTPTPLSSSQRPHSRPHLRSHTPHGLPAYKPPSSDSPLLWTYPSGGFRRPPAYESLRGSSQTPSLQQPSSLTGIGEGVSKANGGSASLQSKVGFMPWDSSASLAADEGSYWPMQRKLSFSHGSRETESKSEDEGRAWNGSADALLRMDKEDLGIGSRGGHSGIPVHFSGATSRALGHSESLAGVDSSLGFRALPRVGMPLPCQTFPACRNGGRQTQLGRLGRSSSAAGVRQVGGDVQRQSSLPAREALNQGQPSVSGGTTPSTTQTQRDGKLLEVIERKRCLCKEIKAHRRPDKSLCKQDSMPILPSWRRTPEPRKTGTPPCQRPQAVVWDTAI